MNIHDFARDIAPEISRQIRDGVRAANEAIRDKGVSAEFRTPNQFSAEFEINNAKVTVIFPVFPA